MWRCRYPFLLSWFGGVVVDTATITQPTATHVFMISQARGRYAQLVSLGGEGLEATMNKVLSGSQSAST